MASVLTVGSEKDYFTSYRGLSTNYISGENNQWVLKSVFDQEPVYISVHCDNVSPVVALGAVIFDQTAGK